MSSYPITAYRAKQGIRGQNFDFKLRKDDGKKSYKRCAYESVDDESHFGYTSKTNGKQNSGS